jgi:hypothetical protein
MPPSVYIETSIVSYLVARPSRDPVMAERQRQTRDWWENRRREYRLFASELTYEEAELGEATMAGQRIAMLTGLALLPATPEAESLAKALVARGPLPPKARTDALHISTATVGGLDYLLTWNCTHIANPRMYPTIRRICRERGYTPPVLCTPDDLLGR